MTDGSGLAILREALAAAIEVLDEALARGRAHPSTTSHPRSQPGAVLSVIDEELDEKERELFAAWGKAIADRPVSIKELVDIAAHNRPLWQELYKIGGERGTINTRCVARFVALSARTPGARIAKAKVVGGYQRWRLATPDPFGVGIMVDTTAGKYTTAKAAESLARGGL